MGAHHGEVIVVGLLYVSSSIKTDFPIESGCRKAPLCNASVRAFVSMCMCVHQRDSASCSRISFIGSQET